MDWNPYAFTIWEVTLRKERDSVTHSIVSDSLWPHGPQPSRLLCPWNSPDKNTGVGSHSLLQGIFLDPGIKAKPPTLQADSLLSEPHGKPKNSACNAGDTGSIPVLGRPPGEGNGYLLQYSCLENRWTEEFDGLQSMELQRVGHDWMTNTFWGEGEVRRVTKEIMLYYMSEKYLREI